MPWVTRQVTWVATSPLRCYQWPKGTSNISGDKWHVTVAVTSGVMPLLHWYFFQNFAKSVIMHDIYSLIRYILRGTFLVQLFARNLPVIFSWFKFWTISSTNFHFFCFRSLFCVCCSWLFVVHTHGCGCLHAHTKTSTMVFYATFFPQRSKWSVSFRARYFSTFKSWKLESEIPLGWRCAVSPQNWINSIKRPFSNFPPLFWTK